MGQNNPAKQPIQLTFFSGEAVPISGMWRSEHEGCIDPPDLWLRNSTPFPPCPRCGRDTTYILLEEIVHISEDTDFK